MIAGLFDQIVQTSAFASEDEYAVHGEVEVGVVRCSSLVKTDDPDVCLLHLLESANEIGDPGDPNMLGSPGGGLGYSRGDGGAAAFGQKNSVDSGALGSPEKSPQIMRIFETIQGEEESRVVIGGRGQEILNREEGSLAKVSDDSLMGFGLGEPAELIARLCRDADARGTGEGCEAFELGVATLPGDGDAIKPTGAGANGLFNGMQAVENFHKFEFTGWKPLGEPARPP
jgi:hypothetical protein